MTKGGEIGKLELESLAQAYGCGLRFDASLGLLNCEGKFLDRLAFSKFAGELVWAGKYDELADARMFNFDRFSVQVVKVNSDVNSLDVKKRIGDRSTGRPDLDNPVERVLVFSIEDRVYVTRMLWEFRAERLDHRHPQRRPVFHPTSLKPRLARLLVNLSGLKPGQTLLDPFCGVGGILIEAGIMGINPTGVEFRERWARGAEENLNYYSVKASVVNADFLEWDGGSFDSIVTDLPYGRSSVITDDLEALYSRAINKFHHHTEKAVVMGPVELDSILEETGWGLKAKIMIPVHKSLVRWIHVIE